ncbi:MAG: hypothetical protein ACREFF_04210 [Candidatus Udaeobacter sp.]
MIKASTTEVSTWFTSECKKSGMKLDMGKGCARFKKLEDLALEVVGRTARSRNRSELRACPWRSTWPITVRRGRSWASLR